MDSETTDNEENKEQEELDEQLESLEDEVITEDELISEDSVESQLLAAKADSKDNYDKYLRAVAEFENFKKRSAKERSEMLKYAGQYLATDLLNVLDDLTRATSQDNTGSAEEVLKGISLIRDAFTAVLKRHSIESAESKGEKFDPNQHEALSIVPSPEHEPGVVIEEFKKAYFFKDKLLRPAQVVVSAEAPKIEAEEA